MRTLYFEALEKFFNVIFYKFSFSSFFTNSFSFLILPPLHHLTLSRLCPLNLILLRLNFLLFFLSSSPLLVLISPFSVFFSHLYPYVSCGCFLDFAIVFHLLPSLIFFPISLSPLILILFFSLPDTVKLHLYQLFSGGSLSAFTFTPLVSLFPFLSYLLSPPCPRSSSSPSVIFIPICLVCFPAVLSWASPLHSAPFVLPLFSLPFSLCSLLPSAYVFFFSSSSCPSSGARCCPHQVMIRQVV